MRITNYGLDAVALVSSANNTYYGYPYFYLWSRYTAIGTGTTAPGQSDLSLASEVARTDNAGGFPYQESIVADPTENKVRYIATEYRVFNFTASYNLTEYGHFTDASGANCVYRDLFRQDPNDPNSLPVVITVLPGEQLQIVKTVIIEASWQPTTYSIVITGMPGKDGAGTHDVSATVFADSGYGVAALHALRTFWAYSAPAIGAAMGAISPNRDTGISAIYAYPHATVTAEPYSMGTYTRDFVAEFPTSQANGEIYGFVVYSATVNYGSSTVGGYKLVFTNPSTITKASTHKLKIVFRVTWGRG